MIKIKFDFTKQESPNLYVRSFFIFIHSCWQIKIFEYRKKEGNETLGQRVNIFQNHLGLNLKFKTDVEGRYLTFVIEYSPEIFEDVNFELDIKQEIY